MTNSKINLRFGLIALLILMAALSRLLPHPSNFAPIAGMGLFGAAYFSKKYYAFLIPFIAYWVSDLLLDNIVYTQYYDGFQWMGSPWVYASFALIIVLGFVLLKKVSINNLVIASLSSSVLFFLRILMTVAAMESLGMIFNFEQNVSYYIPQQVFVNLMDASSAVIDNVPLVAASIGLFQEAADANVWHELAYAAGTGGSMLIIGSAAGVVAMGMEKISFFWYLKSISLLALLGYLTGISWLFFLG